jgi:hypothetical protein
MTMDTNLNPSQPSSSGVPSSTTISYHPSAYSPPLNLPSAANSIPGLEFIGFDHKTATHIFKTYDKYTEPFSSPEATNYDFFSFIHGHIIHINNSKFEGHEDTEKLLKLGIRKDTIATILDQRFRGVFGTQTLGYWVEDTLKVNYATLLRLQDLDPEDPCTLHYHQHSTKTSRGPYYPLQSHSIYRLTRLRITLPRERHPQYLFPQITPRWRFQRTNLSDISYTSTPNSRDVLSVFVSPVSLRLYLPHLPLYAEHLPLLPGYGGSILLGDLEGIYLVLQKETIVAWTLAISGEGGCG